MRIARMQLHSSGNWRVRINGQCHYLGKDSSEAKRKYRGLVAEHYGPSTIKANSGNISVTELLAQYITDQISKAAPQWRRVRECVLEQMWKPVEELYPNLSANDFGPKAYKAVRAMMCNAVCVTKEQKTARCNAMRVTKRSTPYVNGLCSKLKAAFKWGVSEELVSIEAYQRLKTVPDLTAGELGLSDGREVKPVSEALFKDTLPFLSETMSDFLRLLWLSGCRPGELLGLTPAELVKEGAYLVYRPKSHKTARKNKLRAIVFGSEGIVILNRYWPADDAKRFFPMYSRSEVIRTAIYRACKRANLPPWHPYQLRHAALTRISLQFGKDVAQAVGGHAKATMTEHYDAGNVERAKRAAG